MLNNDEIKRRYFEMGAPIDRHGNYQAIHRSEDATKQGFCTLLHYHLLNGMSDKAAIAALKGYDLSDVEVNFIMKKTKEFIADVLELPLDDIRKGLASTVGHMWREFNRILGELNTRYENLRYEDIVVGERRYQATEKSRAALAGYIQSAVDPMYWIDAMNTPVEPFDLANVQELYAAIIQRDNDLHMALNVKKQKLRTLAEQNDFTAVMAMAKEENLA
ncbi:hypothetical protein BIZ83_gp110 [Erwinia phage vB_EamM_ChrisDB]|uniref:hypothetical protein n=1 Tax=Erwinia phage vB_EamM_ChrisDB TaxID=1883371 RepID=UPI00081C6579|nr:hypothetical protein BIZ83_gp110 [Erwinia phage vB_EamM_ChrisDB]ANZ48743.1 hypothetical protein CHRISDB_181 [Erwinia phage vB_EamM_ChrisDB]